MPIEWIAVLSLSSIAVVLLLLFCIFRQKKSNNTANKTDTSIDALIDKKNNVRATAAIAGIESFILKDNDGAELELTRPNINQISERKYKEVAIRGSSVLAQTAQAAMPVLAKAHTLSEIAKAAPNGLFTATAPIGDLMKYADGTIGSIVRKNGAIVSHSGFAEVAISSANPAAVIGGAMQAMALVSGQYYMSEISAKLEGIDMKLDKLIGYHHDEKIGRLKQVGEDLRIITRKSNVDAADIVACQRLYESCGKVFHEYHTRLEGIRVEVKERWFNKPRELKELHENIDDSELDFTIKMCYQASSLREKCKIAEIAVRMKMGMGQERFVAEQVEDLKKNSMNKFHHNVQAYIEEHYESILNRTNKTLDKGEKITDIIKRTPAFSIETLFLKTILLPKFSQNLTESAEGIQNRKNIVISEFQKDGNLAHSLTQLLSNPQETLILLGETPDEGRIFVLDDSDMEE